MLNEAYKHCESTIKHHSKTFYKAFSLLPSNKKKAVWAVYSFCRRVDDIVDEGTDPETELSLFRSQFSRFLNGEKLDKDPMWIALHDVFQRFSMDPQPFHEMILGQEMDLYKSRYKTLNELEHYSYHVASTVGLMLLPILAPKRVDVLRDSAVSLGIGMQITNILRDISEDLDRDRIYLPYDEMKDSGLSIDALYSRTVTPEFIKLWETLATHADYHYEKAFSTIDQYPLDARLPVKSSAIFYRAILQSIRKKGYNIFDQRAYVTDDEKEQLLSAIGGN
ncbi:phytoene/squalene synthase family protein [Guptibacillus algicola]|uniref:phytoene/squalene synthase family protein n=1 Tax=Guptibacillus algicola TaxID=225844 RepID=UPI001CD66FED|nr:phytoene/squalene synthase family protein [Alkalihalobacillus algicola]MCA0988248.1 squalene/phytoene synthase family protein [Alkalihalobacillus algicola]